MKHRIQLGVGVVAALTALCILAGAGPAAATLPMLRRRGTGRR